MYRPVLKCSRLGLITAGIFLSLAAAVFCRILLSAATNPADSGESGIMLLPFAMPWIMLMPQAWIGPLAGLGAIILNALILFLLFGGLRFRASEPPANKACPHCRSYPLRKKFPPRANFLPYNLCQDCGHKFTVDPATVKRHVTALVLSPFMLGTTVMAYLRGGGWTGWMIVSHVVFWSYFIYANAKVVFVPYAPEDATDAHDEQTGIDPQN